MHENEGWNKRVESTGRPCLDEGSIPSSSTKDCPREEKHLARDFHFVTKSAELLSFCYFGIEHEVAHSREKNAKNPDLVKVVFRLH